MAVQANIGIREILGTCWRYWRSQPYALILIGALTIVATAADLGVPLAVGRIVDAVTRRSAEAAYDVYFLVIAASLALLAQAGSRFWLDRTWNKFSIRSLRSLQLDLFAKVQSFSADWHANTFAGATVHKISRGRWSFDAIGFSFLRLIPLALLVIGLGTALTLRAPAAGASFFAIFAIFVWASWMAAAKWVRPMHRLAADHESKLTATIADSISNHASVRDFGAEAYEEERLRGVADQWALHYNRASNRAVDMNAVQQLIWAGLQAAILLALATAALSGHASAGDIAFAVAANMQLGGHLRGVGQEIRMLQRSLGDIADAVGFLGRPRDIADASPPRALSVRRGEIVFDSVSFAYPGRPPIYDKFNLRIAPGERIGLIGDGGGEVDLRQAHSASLRSRRRRNSY
jgi:ATP-binding cassette subfamily B protein